ncbi:MAG: hypothetical protein JNM17_22065 [Archangium sp.]|nr:hypothetical protein [Archangium sp.]
MTERATLSTDAVLLGEQLRRGAPIEDDDFDALLSVRPQVFSRSFWTPVHVARVAARLFREAGASSVLDVGSGAGKFCSIVSLVLDQRVWGVEHRPSLAHESRSLARRLGADVEILEGRFVDLDARRFDAFYFFNPFAEHLVPKTHRYDQSVECSLESYVRDARCVEGWLTAAPIGTALVTYNGLGGRIPTSYVVEREGQLHGNAMRLWVKRTDVAADAFIELEDMLLAASYLRRCEKEMGDDFPFARDLLVRELMNER